ncbi:MAG: C40 family peptidase [Bacteroidia bacterium]|jgi:cell wall-associated NlpC family hydrolase|nr:C40 family peptidase [Bacteroidia bacterium]
MIKKLLCLCSLIIFTAVYGSGQVPLFIDDDSLDIDNVHLPDTTISQPNVVKKRNITSTKPLVNPLQGGKIDSLIDYAFTFMGSRYRRGGTTTKGFDCSGFTMTVFKPFGIKLPHTSAGQGLVGVQVSVQQLQKGDLVFFRGGNRRSRRIGHVGIVITERGQPVQFIHSSTSEGIRVDRLDAAYYKLRYIKAVRIAELYH